MTQTLIKKKDNGPVVCFSLLQAGFWMSFCISVSFASVYLQSIGCSNSLLGLILALAICRVRSWHLDWLIGGLLYDHLSVVTTLYIAFAIGIIGAFIMFLGIRDKERQTDPKRSDMI